MAEFVKNIDNVLYRFCIQFTKKHFHSSDINLITVLEALLTGTQQRQKLEFVWNTGWQGTGIEL